MASLARPGGNLTGFMTFEAGHLGQMGRDAQGGDAGDVRRQPQDNELRLLGASGLSGTGGVPE
jgi:hypothetical protein